MDTNWVRKLAVADIVCNRLRSAMIILSVIIITVLSSTSIIIYLSFLGNTDRVVSRAINISVGFYIFIIVPVLICGLLLIIDCFHLNRQSSVNQNGLLAAIGLTRRQHRGIIRWTTLYLTFPGAIISFIITLPLVYLIIPHVSGSLSSDFQTIGPATSMLVLFCGSILSMGLVNAGLYITYYNTMEMSPSDMISYNEEMPDNKNTVLSRFLNKNSITEKYPQFHLNRTAIAYKNFKRNIRNNTHVFVSIIIALSTLLTVNIIINGIDPKVYTDEYLGKSDFKLINKTFSDEYVEEGSPEELFSAGNIPVYKSPSTEVFDEELVSAIINNDKIKSLKIIKHLYMLYYEKYEDDPDTEQQEYFGDLLVVDTEYILSRFEGKVKPDKALIDGFEKGEIAFLGDSYDDSRDLGMEISGNIVRENMNEASAEFGSEDNGFLFSVYSIPSDISAGNPYIYSDFYIHENILNNIGISPIISSIEFSADPEARPEIQKWLDEIVLKSSTIEIESRDRYEAILQGKKDAVFLVGYILAVLLVFISFLGFAIMNSVSMAVRQKEFFLLRCVGMRSKDIRSMLITEGLIYGSGILLIITFVANPLIWLIYNNFKAYYTVYHFPMSLFVISMILTFTIVLIIPVMIYNRQECKLKNNHNRP